MTEFYKNEKHIFLQGLAMPCCALQLMRGFADVVAGAHRGTIWHMLRCKRVCDDGCETEDVQGQEEHLRSAIVLANNN